MKKSIFHLLLVSFCLFFAGKNPISAQILTQNWINFSQSYYKLSVAQTGIYRITKSDIDALNLGNINPKQMQIFFRGKEQAIFVQGESDNTFDANDYIEFYGKRNDGTQDVGLYVASFEQMNPYYNLYSDTTAYFLTYNLTNSQGKRMVQSPSQTMQASNVAYHWAEDVKFFAERYTLGQNYRIGTNEFIYLAESDQGEGWVSNPIDANSSRDFSFVTPNFYNANPALVPKLEVTLAGNTIDAYRYQVWIGSSVNSLRLVRDATGYSHEKKLVVENVLLSDFGANTIVRVTCPNGSGVGGIVVAYTKITYPQNYVANGNNPYYFNVPNTNNANNFLQINNTPNNCTLYNITNEDNISLPFVQNNNGNIQTIINGAIPNKLYLHNNQPLSVLKKERIFFQQITNPAQYNYLIVSHPKLRIPLNGQDMVQAYANFKATPTGGSFAPLVMNIDMLYNQFAYGEKTPLAIRRFAEYMYQNRPVNNPVRYMFLMGKSVALPDKYNNLNVRQNPIHFSMDLVPTGGVPASDNVLVAGFNNTGTPHPDIPIGRLSVSNPDKIKNYLDKVMEHESTDNTLWQKNFIHLTGGNNATEQVLFRSYADFFKTIAEGLYLGARVSSASKTTTNPVELLNISDLVNRGVGLITFFGHSSINTTDLEIGYASDDLQNYRNKGKYPMVFTNGCQLGGIFSDAVTLSEDWVLTKDRGSIGFVAHSFFGYSIPLYEYTARFYTLSFQDLSLIGKPIGNLLKENARLSPDNVVDKSTAQQMILQGDPSIRFVNADKVDYYTANNQLYLESYDNKPITASTDSFKLKIIVSNLGRIQPNQNLSVRVKRTYSNGTVTTLLNPTGYPYIRYRDTLTFVLKRENALDAFGLNRIQVELDYLNLIDEIREDNNSGILEFFFPKVGVIPVYPPEYSIQNVQPVNLRFLASSGTNEGKNFVVEIDTVATFNSSAKRASIIPAGSQGNWEVNLLTDNSTDSTVYFWRVNYAEEIGNPNAIWGESSFIYIKNSSEGWSQSRYTQLPKAQLNQMVRDDNAQRINFAKLSKPLIVKTIGGNPIGIDTNYVKSNTFVDFFGPQISGTNECGINTIVCMAFDKTTGNPYLVNAINSCGQVLKLANFYNNAQIVGGALQSFLAQVSAGDFVLFFTKGNIDFSSWSSNNFNVFGQIGGNPNKYNTLQNAHPYIILGKKGGAMGSAYEVTASNPTTAKMEKIQFNGAIEVPQYYGTITSSVIGPATKWKEVIHTIKKENPSDYYRLEVFGMDENRNISALPVATVNSLSFNIANISATQYPYMVLKATMADTLQKTAPQLKKWMVLYDGVPEGMIDVAKIGAVNYVVPPKDEAEDFKLDFAFTNIGNVTFLVDSLNVTFTIRNKQTLAQTITTKKIKAPALRESTRFDFWVRTLGLGGNYELKVFVNPYLTLEYYYENNVLTVPFTIRKDVAPPLLDVAFDGKKIMDGEIVSPNPLITVALRDNNRNVPMNTSNLLVALKRPCQTCDFEDINPSQPLVTYSIQNGVLQFNIQRENLPNGIYTLRAQGTDGAGNRAGSTPYTIRFEVVNEATVTNVYPYPNPFSSHTRFVFTLTGKEIPDEIKIQIMTVSGRVIREITQAEIGTIRVGNNITDYMWDGTDEFGDKLANGVYLYRVIMRAKGQDLDLRSTAGDKAFKNGIGKLYIAR